MKGGREYNTEQHVEVPELSSAPVGDELGDRSMVVTDHELPISDGVTPDNAVTWDRAGETSLLSQSTLGIDLVSELRDKYLQDPMYQSILAKPQEYRNFEVENQLICLKSAGK